jgi:hypothetical protein
MHEIADNTGYGYSMSTLLAGAFLGEFGWHCAVWVPLVRKYSRKFDRTVIVCRESERYLYEDFCDEFHYHNVSGLADRWFLDGKKTGVPGKVAEAYPGATLCRPREKKCKKWPREYFRYGQDSLAGRYKIVFHARAMTKYGQSSWNYPVKKLVEVIKILGIDPCECASVGTVGGAWHVPRTVDLRGEDLRVTCSVLAHSGVCVGSSSGAMHLAHLCGCPIVVITGNKWQKSVGGTNKSRYYKLWRAWDTPVKVLENDSWQPCPEKVARAAGKILCI